MRIKKVEISAFRIYDDPAVATFDFTGKSGETADFISLYAPNGFGKTSFYDAVEWGITGTIHRFYIHQQETKKLADYQVSEQGKPLIRHMDANRDTYVNITPEHGPVITKKFKGKANQTHDLNFKKLELHKFQQVILSQEWISAFLTEDDGEERFKKFMKRPDLISIDNYYTNIKLQIAILEANQKKLADDIEKLKPQVQENGGEDLLKNINQQISLLIQTYKQEGLFTIQLTTTKEEIKKLKDTVTRNMVSRTREEAIDKSLADLTLARVGDNKVLGVIRYYADMAELNVLKDKIKEAGQRLKDFEELEKNTNELAKATTDRDALAKRRAIGADILGLFENFLKIKEEITRKNLSITNEQKALSALPADLEKRKVDLQREQSNRDIVLKQLEALDQLLQQMPGLKDEETALNSKIKETEATLATGRDVVLKTSVPLNQQKTSLESWQQALPGLDSGLFAPVLFLKDSGTLRFAQQLTHKKEALEEYALRLRNLSAGINNQIRFNDSLQEFIAKGVDIVNERQSSECPLCETNFENYLALADRIKNNKALNVALQGMLKEKSELDLLVQNVTKEQTDQLEELRKIINARISSISGAITRLRNELDQANQQVNTSETALKNFRGRLAEISLLREGMTFEAFIKAKEEDKTKKAASISKAAVEIKKIETDVASQAVQINTLTDRIKVMTAELETLNKDAQYNIVINWCNANIPGENIDRRVVEKSMGELGLLIRENRDLHKLLTEQVGKKIEALKSFTKDAEERAITGWTAEEKILNRNIKGYTNFLEQKAGIQITGNAEQLEQVITVIENRLKAELEQLRKLGDEYTRLMGYSDNIEGFLQSEIAKAKLTKLKKEKEFLDGTVSATLYGEKTKVREFLEKKVTEFFFEPLINDLYQKIDPHPDFKSVRFSAKFDLDTPRLDVFVTDKEEQVQLIPNLYFSTAQVNILSLCIFLASALNSEDYGCIFIDDPVQSMDSINILSTIDLLRSIVVKYSKQVILSTHDRNFYNLLQKKIPSELFKSKFLELESFGKLKAV